MEFSGAADGAGGWLSWLWPKTKAAFAGGPSPELVAGWPNTKVLEAAEGAGAGAWLEAALLPNRLWAVMEEGDAVAVAELVGLLTMKENSAFGAFEESAEGYK